MREERLRALSPLHQPILGQSREITISRELTLPVRLDEVPKLLTGNIGFVEWDHKDVAGVTVQLYPHTVSQGKCITVHAPFCRQHAERKQVPV